MKLLNTPHLKSEDINKAIHELEKAKSNYMDGDIIGALEHLKTVEELVKTCKGKVSRELGVEGYDAIIIPSRPVKKEELRDAIIIE